MKFNYVVKLGKGLKLGKTLAQFEGNVRGLREAKNFVKQQELKEGEFLLILEKDIEGFRR